MTNFLAVQMRERLEALYKIRPYNLFINVLPSFLVPFHLLCEVSVRTIFHHYAQLCVTSVQESLQKTDDVRVLKEAREAHEMKEE